MATANAQQSTKPEGNPPGEKAAGQEFAPRGQRAAREIKYSDWRKICFKTPGTNMVCRTSITGTFETGQATGNCAWGDDGSSLYILADMYLVRIRLNTQGSRF